jgi:hypothetical protein
MKSAQYHKVFLAGYFAGLVGEVDSGENTEGWLDGYGLAYENGERQSRGES